MPRGAARPSWARAHDGELGAVVPFGDQAVAHLARDVGLRASDEAAVGDLVDHAVCGLRREPQQGDLVGVLHDPQIAQDERRGLEHDVRKGGLQPQQLDRPEAVRDREAADHPGEEAGHAGDRVLRLLPGRNRHGAACRGGAGAGRGHLEARHEQGDRPLGRDHQHRQSLQRHRRVPGEVEQVRTDTDEEGVEAPRPRAGLGTCDAIGVARSRDGRPGRRFRGRRAHSRGASAGPAAGVTAREPGAGTGTPSQAASAAWPSSKSFR